MFVAVRESGRAGFPDSPRGPGFNGRRRILPRGGPSSGWVSLTPERLYLSGLPEHPEADRERNDRDDS